MSGEIPSPSSKLETESANKEKWFGVTIGSLAYHVKAVAKERAIKRVLNGESNIDTEYVTSADATEVDEQLQIELDERYENQHMARVIPNSNEAWPDDPSDINAMTDTQYDAWIRAYGPTASNQ